MKIEMPLQAHVAEAFAPLNQDAAAHAFPAPGSLSAALDKASPPGLVGDVAPGKTPVIARMFTTAAVDVWMRGVHSFLISASLTNVSPIWASASGYYSSHYSVRAIAHLLGFFQLFTKKKIVRLEFQSGRFVCSFGAKTTMIGSTDSIGRLLRRALCLQEIHFSRSTLEWTNRMLGIEIGPTTPTISRGFRCLGRSMPRM